MVEKCKQLIEGALSGVQVIQVWRILKQVFWQKVEFILAEVPKQREYNVQHYY